MAISSTSLTTTPTAVFTATGTTVISTMHFCNVDDSNPHTVSVWLVYNGGTATNTNKIYNAVNITAKDTFVVDREKVILENGDAIFAMTDVNNQISATISSFRQ